jgi:hypothetical protein
MKAKRPEKLHHKDTKDTKTAQRGEKEGEEIKKNRSADDADERR